MAATCLEDKLNLVSDYAEAVECFLANQMATATRRAYKSDFRIFQNFCEARELKPFPAQADTVAAFLSAEAVRGVKSRTLGRRIAAIGHAHKSSGVVSPTDEAKVKAVMSGIRRTLTTAEKQRLPITIERLLRMLNACPETLKGKRDRAILAFGFAGAFRRSELAALTTFDLLEVWGGVQVTIRSSKTDQEGRGQEIAILDGRQVRPVETLRAWLKAADIKSGPIFRSVGKSGRISAKALGAGSISDIVKDYALAVGLDPALFSAHGLRSGFLTTGAESGASIFKLMEVSRHKSFDVLQTYIRRADLFRDHAGSAFL